MLVKVFCKTGNGALTSLYAVHDLCYTYSTSKTNVCDKEIFNAKGLGFFLFEVSNDEDLSFVKKYYSILEIWEVEIDKLLPSPTKSMEWPEVEKTY